MGINVSKNSELSPISVASTFIGFISFAFTVATFLRVVWGNLRTMKNANSEVPDRLGNLKQALYEERAHLRAIRRRCRGEYDEAAFKLLADGVRHMIRDFKQLEEPFLLHPAGGYHDKQHYSLDVPEPNDYYNCRYKSLSLWQRVRWVYERSAATSLSERLAMVQTRRTARQSTDMAITVNYLARSTQDLEDMVTRLEQRMSRVVGVRRIDTGDSNEQPLRRTPRGGYE